MHKMGPRGPKQYIFCDHFDPKNAKKLRFHVFFHFNARKHTQPTQRRCKGVLILVSKTSYIGLKWKSLRPFFKTSSKRHLGDALKTSSRRHPQDVFQETSSRRLLGHILKTSSRRRPQDVYQETSSRCLPRDVLKTFLRRLKASRISVKWKGPRGDYMNFPSRHVSNYLHITTPSLDKQIELI